MIELKVLNNIDSMRWKATTVSYCDIKKVFQFENSIC